VNHIVHYSMHGQERGSTHGSSELLPICHRVHRASGIQLVRCSSLRYEEAIDEVQEGQLEAVWVQITFGVLLPQEGPTAETTG
jgi:hypothetical protein